MPEVHPSLEQSKSMKTLSQPAKSLYEIKAKLTGNDMTDQFGVVEISSATQNTTTGNIYLDAERPSEDSLDMSRVGFTRGGRISNGNHFDCVVNPDRPVWVVYDSSDGTPVAGEEVGTIEDSFKVSADNTGMRVYAVDSTEGLCLVRPFSASGGDVVLFGYDPGIGINTTFTTSSSPDTFYSSFSDLVDTSSDPYTLDVEQFGSIITRNSFRIQLDRQFSHVLTSGTVDLEFANASGTVLFSVRAVEFDNIGTVAYDSIDVLGNGYQYLVSDQSSITQVRLKAIVYYLGTGVGPIDIDVFASGSFSAPLSFYYIPPSAIS